MLLLFETAAGFALFKVLKEGKLKEADVGCIVTIHCQLDQIVLARPYRLFASAGPLQGLRDVGRSSEGAVRAEVHKLHILIML